LAEVFFAIMYFTNRLIECTLGIRKMLNCTRKSFNRRTRYPARSGLLLIVTLAVLLVFPQSACLRKKNKAAMTPISGVRIAMLPFNVPSGNQDLRWAAMAGPILLFKASEYAKDLDVVPLWESMPITLEAAGTSRSISSDSATYIASWLAVKWSAMGDLSPTKSGVSMMIDFMPAQSTQIPFQFTKAGSIDEVGSQMSTALNQFLYYLAAGHLNPIDKKLPTMSEMRGVAEALNREYGWFVEAEPGKSQDVVSKLASSDERLARLLFNPGLYPILAPAK
jgi:hypothetical protein